MSVWCFVPHLIVDPLCTAFVSWEKKKRINSSLIKHVLHFLEVDQIAKKIKTKKIKNCSYSL